MDVERLWAEATDLERRVLVEERLKSVAMYPDHLEVTVSGAPRLNVTLEEVGLTGGVAVSCRRGVANLTRTARRAWQVASRCLIERLGGLVRPAAFDQRVGSGAPGGLGALPNDLIP
jgi:hypothetical protein